jgi:hypothetical protein
MESVDRWEPVGYELLHRVERKCHITLNWATGETGSAGTDLVKITLANRDDIGIEIVDCILALRSDDVLRSEHKVHTSMGFLERMLQEAGSVWKVGFDDDTQAFGLQRRVDETATAAAEATMGGATRASEHLRIAWNAAYRREPDASKTYNHAIKAVEAAARPIVTPNDANATLGRMINAMNSKPDKWRSRFTDPGIPVVPVIVEMMKLIWKSQLDRHGTDDETVALSVTLDESHDALQLAITLVQWFQGGAITLA